MKNYYEILGVDRKAAKEEIKSAYKKLAVKFHPDKNEGSPFFEEMFKKIQEAYENLSDDFKRRMHDAELDEFQNRENYYRRTEQDLKNQAENLRRQQEDWQQEKERARKQASENETDRPVGGESRLNGLRKHRNTLYLVIFGLIFLKFILPSNKTSGKGSFENDEKPEVKREKKSKTKQKEQESNYAYLESGDTQEQVIDDNEEPLIQEDTSMQEQASNDNVSESNIELPKAEPKRDITKARLFIRSDYNSKKDISFLENEVGKDPVEIDFFDTRLVRKRLKYLLKEDFEVIDFFRNQSKDCGPILKFGNYIQVIYRLPDQPYMAILFIDVVNNEFIVVLCNGFPKNLSLYSEKLTIPPIVLNKSVELLNTYIQSEYKYEVNDNLIAVVKERN